MCVKVKEAPCNGRPVIVCGTGINAHTLLHTLLRVGGVGEIYFCRPVEETRGFAEVVNPKVEVLSPDLARAEDLPEWLLEAVGPCTVLFTDERFHPGFSRWKSEHPECDTVRFHLGSVEHLDVILDRYEFCRFISERNLAPVPSTIPGEDDPVAVFGDGFVVRTRKSWYGVTQRERVKLIRGREAYKRAVNEFTSRGLTTRDLSYQELLSIRDEDNVSICGWYGLEHRHMYCTHKLLQWPPKTGGGDVVEVMEAPEGLLEQAEAVLEALEYEGPFEIEFVFDSIQREYKVTELNPRFWLQHGLIEQLSGNALVSRYLGCEPQPVANGSLPTTWVNPLYAPFRLTRLDSRNLRAWLAGNSWSPMSFRSAIRFGVAKLGRF